MTELLELTAPALCVFGLLLGAYFAAAYGIARTERDRSDRLASQSWNVVGKGR